MRAHLPQAERHGLLLSARAEGELTGVLSSTPPGAYPLPAPSMAVRLRCLLGQGFRVARRWSKVFELLRDHHPVDDWDGEPRRDPPRTTVGTTRLGGWHMRAATTTLW